MRINLETAKLAKEKGYDESCSSVFVDGNPKELGGVQRKNSTYQNQITRPTQSDLQKWLREVHNIYVNSDYYHGYPEVRFYYDVKILSDDNYNGNQDSDDNIYTYEQAMELGLQEALKLIEDESRS
jgi:hypothetical protein